MVHEQGDGEKQEIHLERSEIGGPPAAEIVENQIAGAKKKITHRAKHAALAEAVGIDKARSSHLP